LPQHQQKAKNHKNHRVPLGGPRTPPGGFWKKPRNGYHSS